MTTEATVPVQLLDPGRTQTTWGQLESRYVFHKEFVDSNTRLKVWADFERATEMLRQVIPVCAIWVGGSFVSNKLDPGDIDVVYVVRAEDYAQITDEAALKRIAVFTEDGRLMSRSIRVDSHVLSWKAIPEPNPDNPGHVTYLKWRGYWDDFLQRHTTDKTREPDSQSALPIRGYLEVIVDGFYA